MKTKKGKGNSINEMIEEEIEIMDSEVEKANYSYTQNTEELLRIKNWISNPSDGQEVIDLAVFDQVAHKWTTQQIIRYTMNALPRNFTIPGGLETIKLWDVKYSQPESIYRSSHVPVHGEGQFEYCGCDFKACVLNAASSHHACGYCGRRMFAYCLAEPSTWGVCRKCFIQAGQPVKPTLTSAFKKNTIERGSFNY